MAGVFQAPSLEYREPVPEEYPSGIPVLCYHHVGNPGVRYGVSAFGLRADLQALYENGFYLITPADLENRLMQVPLGRRPVMITFDDGWEDHCRLLPDTRELDPLCALGIVEGFLEDHPDFGGGVTFFVSWDKTPFGGDAVEKLNLILDTGNEVGNHSLSHTPFQLISEDGWRRQVNGALDRFEECLGMRAGEVRALAYPGGRATRDGAASDFVAGLVWNGRPAVTSAFVVDGMITNFSRVLDGGRGRYCIGRIDMSLYSVGQLLQWRNLVATGAGRTGIRSPLAWRP
jgi:peptidoglycan/xylan/chitin deacetylase (PgdA/CDA1 family)